VNIALLLDDDLGFVFWLGLVLNEAGCETVPAKSVRSARALVRRVAEPVGAVIFNPSLAGAGRFVQELRGRNPQMKVIAALAPFQEAAQPPFVDVTVRKPATLDDHAKQEWLGAIRRVSGGAAPAR
jgi:DNA-binding NtrC family response regulator